MTDDELEPLTPEEEATVHELLSALPDPELPADVERRIAAAVTGAQEPSAPTPVATETVLPAREPSDEPAESVLTTPPSGRRRRPWLLQSAAVLVIVALVGAVVAGVLTRGDGGSSDAPLALSQEKSGPITSSGRDYSGSTLAGQVRGLLVGSTSTATDPTPTPQAPTAGATGESAAESQSQSLSMTSGEGGDTAAAAGEGESWSLSDPVIAKVNALVNDPKLRQACIDQLASVPGALPVVLDAGFFDGKPAAIFVLPDETDPQRVAVWVVGPTCSTADNPFPYRFERVVRP